MNIILISIRIKINKIMDHNREIKIRIKMVISSHIIKIIMKIIYIIEKRMLRIKMSQDKMKNKIKMNSEEVTIEIKTTIINKGDNKNNFGGG